MNVPQSNQIIPIGFLFGSQSELLDDWPPHFLLVHDGISILYGRVRLRIETVIAHLLSYLLIEERCPKLLVETSNDRLWRTRRGHQSIARISIESGNRRFGDRRHIRQQLRSSWA